MAIGTALLIGLGLAGGYAASKSMGKSEMASAPTPLPQPPSSDTAQAKAEEIGRKKRGAMTRSIYTSPLGVGGEAQVARKTLLGQ